MYGLDVCNSRLTRRNLLKLTGTASLGLTLGRRAVGLDNIKTAAHQEPGNCSTPRSAIAKTQYGKVRGFLDGGVFTFKGIPYGADTGGENRWLPAKPPKAWTDERFTLVYGDNCPQNLHSYGSIEQAFLQDWDDGPMSEDMLKLNIWTPGMTGKRPVMVYFHGGGFSFGSSYELPSHEGAQMARHHDVVQVSVNHRLNALGFLDVSAVGGAAYADSANVGMTDLVASLEWVRENIASFGGDPYNVMIYGQSGGGSKVTTLMGMTSASGLFHRASVQSGGGGNPPSGEQARELTKELMVQLGLRPTDIASLRKVAWSSLFKAGNDAIARVNPAGSSFAMGGPPSLHPRVGWGPIVDGRAVTVRSFFEEAPQVSKNVPMLIGSVSEEGNRMSSDPTNAEWHASLAKSMNESKATTLIAAMKKVHPEKSTRTLSYGVAGLGQRNNVARMAKMKYDLKAAPAYTYYFSWQSPLLDGVAGAWHTSELAFCFDNAKRCEQGTGNTPEAQALAKRMSTAWATFARTGKPDQPGLTWSPSDPDHCQTMVFDNNCRMVNDPEGDLRRILSS